MATCETKSFCRICGGGCGMLLVLDENDRLLELHPDPDHPMTHGYVCFKGLNAVDTYNTPKRIIHTLKRMPEGDFVRIGVEDALDEIAEILMRIRDAHGAESIATYLGTAGYTVFTARPFMEAFRSALGTPAHFTNNTIDQSSKLVTALRLGFWAAGKPALDESEVVMLVGTNPLVSQFTLGLFGPDPTRELKRAKQRGLKLIIIDPRRTETTRYADLHLQPFPGEDAIIAAGLIHVILREGWEDKDFCSGFVRDGHIARLRNALSPFAPDYVAARAGLAADQLIAAAEMFAKAKTGSVVGSTGASMSPHSNLTEHLLETLNVVCGRYRRVGDRVRSITPWMPATPAIAQVMSPTRPWEKLPPGRIRGARALGSEMLTSTLPDEILTPGKGQIRALINEGGNPAAAIPDLKKVARAFRALELMVSIEPMPTTSARLSHYVFAPKLQYEREDLPATIPGYPLFPVPWAQYQPEIVRPPEGAELVDDWYVYWSLAKRMGLALVYNGVALDMQKAPTNAELMAIGTRGSLVPLDEIKLHPGGKIYDLEQYVLPAQDAGEGKFEPMPEDVETELAQLAATPLAVAGAIVSNGKQFAFKLMARRARDMMNTLGLHNRPIRARNAINPLCMNPEDLAALKIGSGDRVEVASDHGRITAIAQADPTLRRGVVTMTHGWGALPDDADDSEALGVSVNLLISSERDVEAINAMPRMSAIPVNIIHSAGEATPV